MVKGIEHTAIASPDPHKLAGWYVEHLDFVINYQSAGSKTTFVKAPDGSMIEIIESRGAPPAARPASARRSRRSTNQRSLLCESLVPVEKQAHRRVEAVLPPPEQVPGESETAR